MLTVTYHCQWWVHHEAMGCQGNRAVAGCCHWAWGIPIQECLHRIHHINMKTRAHFLIALVTYPVPLEGEFRADFKYVNIILLLEAVLNG